jgi:hypothetical protein
MLYTSFDAQIKRTRKARRKEAVVPLPRSRKRRLTITDSELAQKGKISLSRKTQHTDTQEKSLFFRLPREIREMVYEEVLGDKDSHVVPMHRRLGSFPCEDEGALAKWRLCKCFSRETTRTLRAIHGVPGLSTYAKTGVGALPLLSVCRRM